MHQSQFISRSKWKREKYRYNIGDIFELRTTKSVSENLPDTNIVRPHRTLSRQMSRGTPINSQLMDSVEDSVLVSFLDSIADRIHGPDTVGLVRTGMECPDFLIHSLLLKCRQRNLVRPQIGLLISIIKVISVVFIGMFDVYRSSDELLEDQTSPVNENKTGSTHNLMPIDAELIKKVDQLLDEIKIKVKSFEFDVGETCDLLK